MADVHSFQIDNLEAQAGGTPRKAGRCCKLAGAAAGAAGALAAVGLLARLWGAMTLASGPASFRATGIDSSTGDCLITAGFWWCAANQTCGQPWEQPCPGGYTRPKEHPHDDANDGDNGAKACLGTAGYSWCAANQTCGRPWEQPCPGGYTLDADAGSKPRPGAADPNTPCLLSAGYSWCEANKTCGRPWEQPCPGGYAVAGEGAGHETAPGRPHHPDCNHTRGNHSKNHSWHHWHGNHSGNGSWHHHHGNHSGPHHPGCNHMHGNHSRNHSWHHGNHSGNGSWHHHHPGHWHGNHSGNRTGEGNHSHGNHHGNHSHGKVYYAPNGKPFPQHWGAPPKGQSRDMRKLPGGYGKGSSTLAKWIQENMDKDLWVHFLRASPVARGAPSIPEVYYAPNGQAFPEHWGAPPKIQTLDLRELPGGYGWGSGTLAEWIQEHMNKGRPGDEQRHHDGKHSHSEVYYAPNGQAFPEHWGAPPAIQTEDYRELPGGYGYGSSTLAAWIQENMDKDVAQAEQPSASAVLV